MYNQIPKASQVLAIGTITVGLTWLGCQSVLRAQDRAQEDRPEIGFVVEGNPQLNVLPIPVTEYTGECPGTDVGYKRAWFTSSKTPPRRGLRVKIRNITRGMDPENIPYTDREYDGTNTSEETKITFGTSHTRRRFVVMDGVANRFEYEIFKKKDKSVIERGDFIVQVQKKVSTEERNKREVEEEYCSTGAPMRNCDKKNVRVRKVLKCP